MDQNGSAQTSGGPLANTPGVIFLQTQADLLLTPPESIADPKIHGGLTVDPPHGGIRELISHEKKFKSAGFGELVFTAD